MARFVAVLLAAVALLAAGGMGHAAPSTAELIRRAVLKSSVVPDAILRRIRTDVAGTDVPGNGVAGMAKGTGRSTSELDYDDYDRLPPTAGNAAPREASGDVRDDDVPFSYKGPSELGAGGRAMASEARRGGEATSQSMAGKEIVVERRAEGAVTTSGPRGGREKATTTTVFFHEKAVRVGERLHFRFPAAAPAPLGLLPRHAADLIPFSTPALPIILALFRVAPGSTQAAAMAETLRKCEWPPLAGESKFCASSLEALVERAMATLGTRDVRPVTSTLPRTGAPLQPYTVRAVRRVDGASFVGCHDEVYPYTVYRCHTTGPARAYMMEMEGAGGDVITVATVCHTDTSRWNPEHLSFQLLGTKPGGAPICHLMPYGHIIWAKNLKQSPA